MADILGFPHGNRPGDTYPCDVEPPCEGNGLETYVAQNPVADPVNHPSHYVHQDVEAIDVIEHVVSRYRDPVHAYLVGQAMKYFLRAPFKGAYDQDMEKGHWYHSRLIRKIRDAQIR